MSNTALTQHSKILRHTFDFDKFQVMQKGVNTRSSKEKYFRVPLRI